MVRQLISSVALVLLMTSSCMMGNRPFPKKYLGTYEGTQEKYTIQLNDEEVVVPAEDYSLELAYDELWLTTEKQVIHGDYEVKAETDMYYALTVNMKNGVTEEWQLWKKGKRLVRKEIKPKPEVIFVQ